VRSHELRDSAIKTPDQCGDAVYFFGTVSRTSQMARPYPLDLTVCPTSDVMAFPLTIVPKLRTLIPHTMRFEGAGSSNRFISYAVFRVLCRSQSAVKMPSKVAARALIFICRHASRKRTHTDKCSLGTLYTLLQDCIYYWADSGMTDRRQFGELRFRSKTMADPLEDKQLRS